MNEYPNYEPKPDCGREKESRKIKSRHAAQSRRILENEEFECLASVLPVPKAISSHLLDKASVIRLTISFLKLNKFSIEGFPGWFNPASDADDFYGNEQHIEQHSYACKFEENIGTRILEAIDGFMFCLSEDGILLYVSETVSIGLGLSQVELIGNRFSDYVHTDDTSAFYQILEDCKKLTGKSDQMTFSLRIKSSLVKRATKDTYESAVGFKAVEIQLSPRIQNTIDGWQTCVGFSGLAAPLPSTTMPEWRLDHCTFVITTLLDFSLQYVDSRGEEVLGFSVENLTAAPTSFYSAVHVEDVHSVASFHKEILRLGSAGSNYFRLVHYNNECFWVHCYGIRVNRPRARQNQNLITLLCHIIGY